MTDTPVRPLYQLGSLYGVQTFYSDVDHRRRTPDPEALVLLLRALGAPLETTQGAPGALRERRQELWRRVVEPVVVAWDGGPARVEVRLPAAPSHQMLACTLHLEDGRTFTWPGDTAEKPILHEEEVEGVRYVVKGLDLPDKLPWGYHRFAIEREHGRAEALVISAPRRAYAPSRDGGDYRSWGVFLPLYALRTRKSWGTGDLGDLEALRGWIRGLGGEVVGTLPLLAAFLDEPCDPSPYSPASRLFWNELYIDVSRAPELSRCPSAQALLESPRLQQERDSLRESELVDYRGAMRLKRQVLEELARSFFPRAREQQDGFERFRGDHPDVDAYARFRAVGERQRTPWPRWPQSQRSGLVAGGDYDEDAYRYHLYAQWLAHEQMAAQGAGGKGERGGLYLDLPLGVHAESYDVWREREVFALEAEGGAPPDRFFTGGQTWGFPPLRPEESRKQGHRYFISCLRHHLEHAGLLRIDHVMGMHRLFWVPRGLTAAHGMYVRYPAEELYAILSLESHRNQAWIVGENLGVVPGYVNRAMASHGIHKMYVLEYEMRADPRRALRPVPRDALASLNTHDMPTFAAFWEGLDIQERLESGLLDASGAQREQDRRKDLREALVAFLREQGLLEAEADDIATVLRACIAYLGASPARAVLINLEDLWLESKGQNVPGGDARHPNWRRKARYDVESASELAAVLEPLKTLNHLRQRQGDAR